MALELCRRKTTPLLGIVSKTIFSNEELSDYVGEVEEREPHYIKIMCGCTKSGFGDILGVLQITNNGNIHATCHCCRDDCKEEFNSSIEFVKHSIGTSKVSNWKSKIWVLNKFGQKIKLSRTCFLKYYSGDVYRRPYSISVHRDEFLRCTACNKLSRFWLRSREACKHYHDATIEENRTCSYMTDGRLSCEDKEERSSSRARSGCHRNIRCKGCVSCVCFGCRMCRFEGCNCRTCVDFYANAAN